MDDLSGQEIRGYVLHERIGAGGFGAVYRATQSSVEREVAVKIILPQYANQADFKRRFEGEARLIARLEHVYIVPLFDYWQEADGSAYLVMRWLRGGSLRRLIREQPLELPLAVHIFDQIAQALASAHQKGVIHRDLKPDNILLDEYENAYLSDFGIAKDLVTNPGITLSGNTPGTPAYAAPEQLTSEPVTPQTDIYSLGITLYESLAGQHPFPKAPLQHLRDPLPLILNRPDIPLTVNNVIAKATAKDPLERYASALEFAAALRQTLVLPVANDEPVTSVEGGLAYNAPLPRSAQAVARTPLLSSIDAPGAQSALLLTRAEDVPLRPEKLIGRDDLLVELNALLDRGQRVLLHGMGGMGKTSLAAEITALRLESGQQPDLWLQAGTEKTPALLAALVHPFDSTSIEPSSVRKLITDAGVKLIVLDDAWDGTVLKQVIDILPRQLPVLVTSRQRYPLNKILDVSELELNTALEVLNFHTGRDYTTADEDAVALCRLVGFHPFTLEIAGKTLLVDDLTAGELLQRIDQTPHLLKMPEDFAEPGRDSVNKLLTDSVSTLEAPHLQIFLAFGMLYTLEATVELLALITEREPQSVEQSLTILARRGLAKRIPGSDLYRIHDLAYSYARANVKHPRSVVIAACLEYVQRHKDSPTALDLERTNILKAAGAAYQSGDYTSLSAIIYALTIEGPYFNARGHDPLLLEQIDHAIEAARSADQQQTLHFLLSKRGNAFYDRGDLADALSAYQEALTLARSLAMPDREVILLCVISKIHADQRDFTAAEADLKAARALAEENDNALTRVLEHEGYVAQAKGDLREAQRVFAEQVELARRIDDPERLFYALLNLGAALIYLDEPEAALSNLHSALEIAERKNNHTWMGLVNFAIGGMYHGLDDHGKAQACFDRARELFRTSGYTAKLNEVEAYMQAENYQL